MYISEHREKDQSITISKLLWSSMKIRVREMKYVVALCLMIAVLLTASGTATSYSEGQLALTATECYKTGIMVGMMNAGKIFAEKEPVGRATYNEMVPMTNDMIEQHNALMLYIFAGNATTLSKLLIEPYSYL